ncbi:response regulator transcription factor [Streptomyces sp. NPDC088847]|uniref:response regulator transcription factor n=1 Tax=Streptomyces sp. NPDC088847 TaxID=3365909 RepID=UPI00381E4F89
MNVVVAGGPTLVRAALTHVISSHPDLSVTGQAADPEQLHQVLSSTDTDLVLLDRTLQDTDAEFDALVRRTVIRAKAVVLGARRTDEIESHLSAGATGVLTDDITAGQLVEALRTVAAGGLVMVLGTRPAPSEPPRRASDHSAIRELSLREREILTLLARGRDTAAIAVTLALSPLTVKTHIANMLGKTGTHQRGNLITLAYESGLVTPGRAVLNVLCRRTA